MASSSDQKSDENPKYPTITRAELAGGYFNKHVAFVIKTPSGADIKRRYSDFEWLRHLLRILYPGAFIPPIPPKLAVAMWPQGYLLMRKRELQQFLQRLEVIPYLKKEEVTSFFLTKHSNSFEKERKKWEKQHPKPSDKALFEKLRDIFPKIHETQSPPDMDKRCKESNDLIDASIHNFEILVKSSNNFISTSRECNDAMADFKKVFEELLDLENGSKFDFMNDSRLDICPYIEQWKVYKMDEMNNMNTYYVPTLNRALNDLRVIKEILVMRDKIRSDYKDAKKRYMFCLFVCFLVNVIQIKRADFWNESDSNNKSIRSSDLAKKHRELQREEDLGNLKCFVEKLVLGQLNVVYCANTRRWKKSTHLFASKHLLALEKVMSGWKDLANEIAAKKGDLDGMSKAVIVETMDDYDEEEVEEDDEKKEVIETKGNEDGMESVDIDIDDVGNKENENVENVDEQTDDEVAEEAHRINKEQEEEDELERIRREEEEKERLEREKFEKEKQEKIEKLKQEQEKSQEKMKEMFKDENEQTQKKDDEFPWDD